jgi:hypothetical protein
MLIELLEKYADSADIVRLISEVIKDPKNYKAHKNLKDYFYKNKLQSELIDRYVDEYHEFMYDEEPSCYGAVKIWHNRDGKKHCVKKVNGKTLPAEIWPLGSMRWFRDGEYFQDDVDESGEILYSYIDNTGAKHWCINNGKLHRVELNKDQKFLPAFIGKVETLFNYHNRVFKTESEFAEFVNNNTLASLEKIYPSLKLLIYAVVDNPTTWEKHNVLKKAIYKQDLTGDLIDKYFKEYHEYMYEKRTLMGGDFVKEWTNRDGEVHCVLKKDGLTLPARIWPNNRSMEWRKNGKFFRDDRDANSYTMYNDITHGSKCWKTENGMIHRAELDVHGMALPAVIDSQGVERYRFNGNDVTREYITNKIRPSATIVASKKVRITLDDGSVLNLNNVKLIEHV